MKKLLWIGLAFLVVLVGCDLTSRDFYRAEGDFPENGDGSLVLVLDGGALLTKTITPTLSMVVDYYALNFTGPTPADTFSVQINAGSPDFGIYTDNGLTPSVVADDWMVVANAYNAGNVLIGDATESFTINEGQPTAVPVNVLPITTGTGNLTLTLNWPDNAIAQEGIVAFLTPVPPGPGNISSDQTAGFAISQGNPNDTAVYDTVAGTPSPLAPGYYNLTLQLYDDTSLAWGWMEAIRIVSGQLTDNTWTLTLAAGGRLDLTATSNMLNPISIGFTPSTTPTLVADDTLTVTATLTLSTPESNSYDYEWFVDGNTTGIAGIVDTSTTPIIVTYGLVANAFLPSNTGNHNLSILVTGKNSLDEVETLSSENFQFIIE